MKKDKLGKEIDRLAKEKGYPSQKLSSSEYEQVLKTAHDNVYPQDNKELFTENWEVWEDYDLHQEPCFSVRSERGNKIVFQTFQNADEPPASKTAFANATLGAQAPAMYKALEKNHELLLRYYTSNTPKLHEEDLKDLRTAMAEIQSILNKANPKP